MSTTATTTAAFTFSFVPFALLSLYEKNPRKDLGDIKGLAATIIGAGKVIKPLTGFFRDGVYQVVDGQRRFAALKLIAEAGGNEEILASVPFQLITGSTAEVDLAFLQLLSNEGEPLKPLELAEQILVLRNEWDMKTAEIAERLGRSKVYVNQLTRVAELPDNVKKLMTNGTLSATLVREKIKEGTIDELVKKVTEGGTTEEGEEVPSEIVKKDKVTQKDLTSVNSIKEFKRFGKAFSEIFPDKTVTLEQAYNLLTQVVHNEIDYNGLLDFFTDEKTRTTAIKSTEVKAVAGKDAKAAKAPKAKKGEGMHLSTEAKKATVKAPVSTKEAAAKNAPAELKAIKGAKAEVAKEAPKKVAAKKQAVKADTTPAEAVTPVKKGKAAGEAKTGSKTTSRTIGYDKKADKAETKA